MYFKRGPFLQLSRALAHGDTNIRLRPVSTYPFNGLLPNPAHDKKEAVGRRPGAAAQKGKEVQSYMYFRLSSATPDHCPARTCPVDARRRETP